jgi:elongation factor G
MKVYDAATLRNVAIVGHSGSGKTQLVSALLFDAGATNRFGKVDDGTTLTDYDDEKYTQTPSPQHWPTSSGANTKSTLSTRRHGELPR